MLSTEAASLVIQGAKGLIKLTRRVDLILAEKAAVEGPLGISPPAVAEPPTDAQAKAALKKFLAGTHDPPLTPPDADEIRKALENPDQVDRRRELMLRWLPGQATRTLELDVKFIEAVRARHPGLAADPDLLRAAFHISAEVDTRNRSYTWRIALTVTDVVLDFGADNAALFTRDEGLQELVASVLRRFGDADLQDTPSSDVLLRVALGATLNAALDARHAYAPGNRWVSGILDALLQARESFPEDRRDDFLVGLLNGQGYPRLVAASLTVGAARLDDADAVTFRDVAADVLTRIAGIVEENDKLEGFFAKHWGDLLRAGLSSVEVHGPVLFQGEDPLLADVLVAVSGHLAGIPQKDAGLLTTDTLDGVVRAALSVVAANPERVDDLLDESWLGELVGSVAGILSGQGLRAFTAAGLEEMLRDTLSRFAQRPELIVEHPGLARELLRGILDEVSDAGGLGAEELARAALSGALAAVSDHPGLLEVNYPQLVADLAGRVAGLVESRGLTRVQGSELLSAVTGALAANPALFLDMERKLVAGVVEGIVDVAGDDRIGLIAGAALVDTVREVLAALSRSGQAALKNHPGAELVAELNALVAAGLTRAEKELGNRLSRPEIPGLLGRLVVAWARGEIGTIDPDNDNFRRLFSELAEQAA